MSNSIINIAETPPADWVFLKDKINDDSIIWYFYNAIPKNYLENLVRKPRISRFRAAFCAVLQAKKVNTKLIISHGPNVTLLTALFCWLLNVKSQHLAFSFTFTKLPTGFRRFLMRLALKSVYKFTLYSEVERGLYANYFNLPIDRFDSLPWTMDEPITEDSVVPKQVYVCAAGGEGRDYETLIKAFEGLDINLIIIARPENLKDQTIPSNVQVLTNVSAKKYWSVINDSKFSVVPMLSRDTNCGHGTIVGAFALSKPVVTTYSYATEEYAINEYNSLISEPGDAKSLAENVVRLWNDDKLYSELAENARKHYLDNYSPQYAVNYLNSILSGNLVIEKTDINMLEVAS